MTAQRTSQEGARKRLLRIGGTGRPVTGDYGHPWLLALALLTLVGAILLAGALVMWMVLAIW